jgi:hypothetical protein
MDCTNCHEELPSEDFDYEFCSEACEKEFNATLEPEADMLYKD